MRRTIDPSTSLERPVVMRLLQEQLSAVLETLAEREAVAVLMRFGLYDGEPKTLDEIGRAFGVNRERVQQILDKTTMKLQHPSRLRVLDGYLEAVAGYRPSSFQYNYYGGTAARMPPPVVERVYCPRHRCWHRWTSEKTQTCLGCPCKIFSESTTGRPRRYCSNSCRQAVYRLRARMTRQAAGGEGTADSQLEPQQIGYGTVAPRSQ